MAQGIRLTGLAAFVVPLEGTPRCSLYENNNKTETTNTKFSVEKSGSRPAPVTARLLQTSTDVGG